MSRGFAARHRERAQDGRLLDEVRAKDARPERPNTMTPSSRACRRVDRKHERRRSSSGASSFRAVVFEDRPRAVWNARATGSSPAIGQDELSERRERPVRRRGYQAVAGATNNAAESTPNTSQPA